MREIVGSVGLKEMVQERQVVAERSKENAVPDMQKLGIEIVNFNIRNFKDGAGTIENMGIDNVEQIRKAAQIAKAEAARDIAIAEANAKEEANKIAVAAHQRIAEQNTSLSIREGGAEEGLRRQAGGKPMRHTRFVRKSSVRPSRSRPPTRTSPAARRKPSLPKRKSHCRKRSWTPTSRRRRTR